MIGARLATGILGLGLLAAAGGCAGPEPAPDAPAPEAPAPEAPAADTVRGTVLVVGADPITSIVLRTDDGRIRLVGAAAAPLRRATRLDVAAHGRLEGETLTVAGFRVRAANGLPAADGVLNVHGDTAVLATTDGRELRWVPIPTSLRARAGAWVWIAGPVGGEPQAWGVLSEEAPPAR